MAWCRRTLMAHGVVRSAKALPARWSKANHWGAHFMVRHDGVVYEKDLGPKTLDEFKRMERFNPDKSWTAAAEENE